MIRDVVGPTFSVMRGDEDVDDPSLSAEELQPAGSIKDAGSVELKSTLPENARSVTAAALDVIRSTPRCGSCSSSIPGSHAGCPRRRGSSRRRRGEMGDTVVKLRPVVPAELPEELRRWSSFNVEVDAMPGGFVAPVVQRQADNGGLARLRPGNERSGSSFPRGIVRTTPLTRPRVWSSMRSRCLGRSRSSN